MLKLLIGDVAWRILVRKAASTSGNLEQLASVIMYLLSTFTSHRFSQYVTNQLLHCFSEYDEGDHIADQLCRVVSTPSDSSFQSIRQLCWRDVRVGKPRRRIYLPIPIGGS